MAETWPPVVDYEGLYEVSDAGRVRNVRRNTILRAGLDTPGYLNVKLYCEGVHKRWLVHRLVAIAFFGPPKPGEEVAHLNGDRQDPRAANLAWATRSENNSHKAQHGTQQHGEKHPRAKLNAKQVAEIRSLNSSTGAGARTLARKFGISRTQAFRILRGNHWKDPQGASATAQPGRPA